MTASSDRGRWPRLAVATCFSATVIASAFLWLPFSLGLMAGWVACMFAGALRPTNATTGDA